MNKGSKTYEGGRKMWSLSRPASFFSGTNGILSSPLHQMAWSSYIMGCLLQQKQGGSREQLLYKAGGFQAMSEILWEKSGVDNGSHS